MMWPFKKHKRLFVECRMIYSGRIFSQEEKIIYCLKGEAVERTRWPYCLLLGVKSPFGSFVLWVNMKNGKNDVQMRQQCCRSDYSFLLIVITDVFEFHILLLILNLTLLSYRINVYTHLYEYSVGIDLFLLYELIFYEIFISLNANYLSIICMKLLYFSLNYFFYYLCLNFL